MLSYCKKSFKNEQDSNPDTYMCEFLMDLIFRLLKQKI